jgi:hypothetical protein
VLFSSLPLSHFLLSNLFSLLLISEHPSTICDTLSTTQIYLQNQKSKMTSKQALSSTSTLASVQTNSRSTGFLDLPLEVRIIIYTKITKRPENHYATSEIHLEGILPSILCTNSQITREIYQFCTVTATFRYKMIGYGPEGIFCFLVWRRLREIAQRLMSFNAQAHHKGIVLNIMLRCTRFECLEEEGCSSCKFHAEHEYGRPIEAIGLERRLITLI